MKKAAISIINSSKLKTVKNIFMVFDCEIFLFMTEEIFLTKLMVQIEAIKLKIGKKKREINYSTSDSPKAISININMIQSCIVYALLNGILRGLYNFKYITIDLI